MIAPLAAVTAVVLITPDPAGAGTCKGADANPAGADLTTVKRATVCLLNQKRRQYGLKKLQVNARLSLASQRHANSMVLRKRFDHGDIIGRIKAAGYLEDAASWSVAENIAWGKSDLATPRAIVQIWMRSKPHRQNILHRKFREIGIGVARGVPVPAGHEGATYTTDFGRRS